MEVVRDDGATWSLVRDASWTGVALAAAVATGAAVLSAHLFEGAPLFSILQLVSLLGLATQLLDEREVVTVSRAARVVRVERSLLGYRRRVVPVAFADIDNVAMESHQSGLMRRPRYRVTLRLLNGIVVPLLSSFALAKPIETARQLRSVLDLPPVDDEHDSDNDNDNVGSGSGPTADGLHDEAGAGSDAGAKAEEVQQSRRRLRSSGRPA